MACSRRALVRSVMTERRFELANSAQARSELAGP
jgi:hypothetical protein